MSVHKWIADFRQTMLASLQFLSDVTGVNIIKMSASLANALEFKSGSNSYLKFDTNTPLITLGQTTNLAGTIQIGGTVLATSITELNNLAAANATFAVTAGTGITGGVGTVIKYSVTSAGTMITSTVYIDLTGLQAVATDGDIIGDSTNPAYLVRITAAKNGTVDMVEMKCLEAPATGSADINLCTAIEATGKKDDAISGLTGVQTLVDAGGNWTNGLIKGATVTPITANNYVYLTNGAGAGAGTYTAGKFLLTFYGF